MNTAKKGIRHIAKICALKGVRHAIISPGSRNAPIIAAFLAEKSISCTSIVDERSAAFFALGIAQQERNPVALICTSGSAVLNYAPAIAEAYYQKIPLIILSADRPHEWIDQGENQSIVQQDIYRNYIKKSVELPVESIHEKDEWYSNRLVNEAINCAMYPEAGPVHINIPLREPLYDLVDIKEEELPKLIQAHPFESILDATTIQSLQAQWFQAKKKMIIVGAQANDEALNTILNHISKDDSTIILCEQISNIHIDSNAYISMVDACIESITQLPLPTFKPEIVITIGGGIVSKKIKFYFRKNQLQHWHVSKTGEHWDTFQNLSRVIQQSASGFLQALYQNQPNTISSDYRESWLKLQDKAHQLHIQYLSTLLFCDFKVFEYILKELPAKSNIHFGNSTPIRYANLFLQSSSKSFSINANRGVSGIDGVTSTASGAAFAHPQQLTFCITGDIAFLYDSNALWNERLSKNLRIIIINNGGGNIFKIIPGPTQIDRYEEYIETKQQVNIESLSKAYHIDFFTCNDALSLEKIFQTFIDNAQAAILEIKTDSDYSASTLKNYFNYLITHYEQ